MPFTLILVSDYLNRILVNDNLIMILVKGTRQSPQRLI